MFRFLGSEDKENFFPPIQRHRIVHQILSTAVYGKRKKAEIGIERLIEENAYSAAFPLHDVSGDSRVGAASWGQQGGGGGSRVGVEAAG